MFLNFAISLPAYSFKISGPFFEMYNRCLYSFSVNIASCKSWKESHRSASFSRFMPKNCNTWSPQYSQRNWIRIAQYHMLKCKWNVFFIVEFERAAKIRKIAVYRFLISLLVPELQRFKRRVISDQKWPRNESKLIKICDVMCWTYLWDGKNR